METKYIYIHGRKRSREYENPGAVVRDGSEKVSDHPWAEFRVAVDGTKGVLRDFESACDRATRLLTTRPIGTVVRLEAVRQGQVIDVVRFRKIEIQHVKDTRGPISLDRVEGYIEEAFPHARWAGDCVCKSNSDHADCAAVDYFDTRDNMEMMRDYLLENAVYFGIKYIILFDRIWFADGPSYAYSGQYHAHIHVSVNGGTKGAAC